MVVFPAPVGPTKATFSPGSIVREIFLRIGVSGWYPNQTRLNSIFPCIVPGFCGFTGGTIWGSVSRSLKIRSEQRMGLIFGSEARIIQMLACNVNMVNQNHAHSLLRKHLGRK